MIRREKYLQQLIANRDNGFPKIITGIRRCGKSFLMKEIFREYLLSDGIKEDAERKQNVSADSASVRY